MSAMTLRELWTADKSIGFLSARCGFCSRRSCRLHAWCWLGSQNLIVFQLYLPTHSHLPFLSMREWPRCQPEVFTSPHLRSLMARIGARWALCVSTIHTPTVSIQRGSFCWHSVLWLFPCLVAYFFNYHNIREKGLKTNMRLLVNEDQPLGGRIANCIFNWFLSGQVDQLRRKTHRTKRILFIKYVGVCESILLSALYYKVACVWPRVWRELRSKAVSSSPLSSCRYLKKIPEVPVLLGDGFGSIKGNADGDIIIMAAVAVAVLIAAGGAVTAIC